MGNLWFTEPYLNLLSHELKRSGPKHFGNRLRFRRTKSCERTRDQSDADYAKYEEPGKLAGRFTCLGRVGHAVIRPTYQFIPSAQNRLFLTPSPHEKNAK